MTNFWPWLEAHFLELLILCGIVVIIEKLNGRNM